MKIYIDVSNLMTVDFVTGIQRVVREVVVRMLKEDSLETILLVSPRGQEHFYILDNEKFFDFFVFDKGEKNQCVTNKTCDLKSIEAGSVFFDIDSVWSSHKRRSSLLPELKSNGIKIAVFIHDIIPITHPQYCHENTMFFFMNYLAAYLQYADIILTSTQSTLDAINTLIEKLELPPVKGFVTWLGSDFAAKRDKDTHISYEARTVARKGKYILCVGTIEPRKNHKFLLDAFDKKLADLEINLVFAGRIGWNVEDLEQRIQSHPLKDRKLFHLSGQNDASIDFLYRNAYLVAFPTYEEGFGLPMIEAIERNCVLVASNIPVLKEIGRDFCDYFNPYNPDELISLVEKYLNSPSVYANKRNNLKNYNSVSWDTVAVKIIHALNSLEYNAPSVCPDVHQMVVLSARPDMLLSTLPYIDKFMPFITEVIICCPDSAIDVLYGNYRGRLKMTFLTDSEILAGSPLPKDHSTRNMFLRCMAMKSPKLNDVFIMSDDDYRPLKEIKSSDYYEDRKYVAYYCFNLEDWSGTAWEPTSFDLCMKRTTDFLKANHYPCKHYASHMPQIIDKRIFNEMLDKHPGIEAKGYCEWCTYFNYLQYNYPSILKTKTYKSMCWPGNPTDWKLQIIPTEYLYENYYEENYINGGIFEGMSTQFNDSFEVESQEKINKFVLRQNSYLDQQRTFDLYSQMYECEYRERPQLGLFVGESGLELVVPKYLILKKASFARIPFELRVYKYAGVLSNIEIHCYYSDLSGNTFYHAEVLNITGEDCKFDFPLYGYYHTGNYFYNVEVKLDKEVVRKSMPISIMS